MEPHQLEAIVAAVLTAGSFGNAGNDDSKQVVERYRDLLKQMRYTGGAANLAEPLEWTEVQSDGGPVLGKFAIEDGMIIVLHPRGWWKRATASAMGENAGLARLI